MDNQVENKANVFLLILKENYEILGSLFYNKGKYII